jgi:hypothetical protein
VDKWRRWQLLKWRRWQLLKVDKWRRWQLLKWPCEPLKRRAASDARRISRRSRGGA